MIDGKQSRPQHGNHADGSVDPDTDSRLGELREVLDWTGLE
jgi:hypothetical protein